jgi:hypothetical protein
MQLNAIVAGIQMKAAIKKNTLNYLIFTTLKNKK